MKTMQEKKSTAGENNIIDTNRAALQEEEPK
jgi:hypothetical protein